MKNFKTLALFLLLGSGVTIGAYSVPALYDHQMYQRAPAPHPPAAPTRPVAKAQVKENQKQDAVKDQMKQNKAQEAARDQIKENKLENIQDGQAELKP